MANLLSAEKQLQQDESSLNLPVFDITTPKVSVLSIGIYAQGVDDIESAKELVKQAIQQTVDFQAQAELKATFAKLAYDKEYPVREPMNPVRTTRACAHTSYYDLPCLTLASNACQPALQVHLRERHGRTSRGDERRRRP